MSSKMVDYTIMRLGKVITTYMGKPSSVIGRCPICGRRGEMSKEYATKGEFPRQSGPIPGQYWAVRVTHTEERTDVYALGVMRQGKDVCEFEFPGMRIINASIRESYRAKKTRKWFYLRREPYIKTPQVFYDSDWPALPYEGLVDEPRFI